MTANVENMMYYGEVPWHGIGTQLDKPATAEEAIVAAKLDWTVSIQDIYVSGQKVENFKAVQRDTDKRVYYIAGDRYTPIQNQKAFEFFDKVIGTGKAVYHTAGALKQGGKIWILAKLDDTLSVKGEAVDRFITLVNSHDGSSALQMFWTPIRVVCSNTLAQAESKAIGQKVYARHTAGYMGKVDIAQEVLGLSNKFFIEWNEVANQLASKPLLEKQLDELMRASFSLNKDTPEEDLTSMTQSAFQRIERLFDGEGRGLDNPDIKHTAWAAVNSIVEYVDYYRKARNDEATSRLNNAWFGYGSQIKKNAWKAAIAMV